MLELIGDAFFLTNVSNQLFIYVNRQKDYNLGLGRCGLPPGRSAESLTLPAPASTPVLPSRRHLLRRLPPPLPCRPTPPVPLQPPCGGDATCPASSAAAARRRDSRGPRGGTAAARRPISVARLRGSGVSAWICGWSSGVGLGVATSAWSRGGAPFRAGTLPRCGGAEPPSPPSPPCISLLRHDDESPGPRDGQRRQQRRRCARRGE